MAYTCRQLNSVSSALHFFNLVAQCDLDDVDVVRNALTRCFDRVEVAYAYDKSAALGKFG